ncbi:hypothetical protein FB45DRAFT_900316 [Roridomyces roridus]|uniref:Actin-like ATPase domain-containing protein n=1 Tax=Roridomyces roridus TaxID=1738132 RepID=A0AAD7C7Z3_9AGAR|nr:hypothetical protein FB45DRAFT_900316 [Roridomyces roridus]
MAADNRRPPYAGTSRNLIVSIDVGTTFTAASFCLLQPGSVPKFEEILRWPKQATADAKVPSVLYYDKDGKPRAFGAETDDEDVIIQAEENEWSKAEWWKLHLRPSHLPIIQDLKLPPLPDNVTLDQILADHLRYIIAQVKEYMVTTYSDGLALWESVSPSMYCILTTPNGWEGVQQRRMRDAAIQAGLVDESGGRRIKFVTEAEAAILYAAESGNVNDWLVLDGQLILCDCGGGTVDITGYKIDAIEPALRLSESSASRCYLAGAVCVTQAAERFFRDHFKGSEWDSEVAIQRMVHQFDTIAKKKFSDEEFSYVQVDGHKSVKQYEVVRGRLKLTRAQMQSFFAPSLEKIMEGLEVAFENGDWLADRIILVGGLASSPYIFRQLADWGKGKGISVIRPDGPTVKAVANGALAWHLDSTVGSRIARYHYGLSLRRTYDPDDPECVEREHLKSQNLSGSWYIRGGWAGIVEKNDTLEVGEEFIRSYTREMGARTEGFEFKVPLWVYRRSKPPPFIMFPDGKTRQPGFELVCHVNGNLEKCYDAAPLSISSVSKNYKMITFDVCLALGETELTARLRWKEDDVDTYGEATVAYE